MGTGIIGFLLRRSFHRKSKLPPKRYKLFVHYETLEVLPKSGSRRQNLNEFFASLPDNAFLGGDFEEIDPESARLVWISEVAGFIISWWIDNPVKEVKIIDIIPVPKS